MRENRLQLFNIFCNIVQFALLLSFRFNLNKCDHKWRCITRARHERQGAAPGSGCTGSGLSCGLVLSPGKNVSECESTRNYLGSRYGGSQTSASFGTHMFVVRELVGMNMIQLLVMVQSPRKLVSDLSRLVQ